MEEVKKPKLASSMCMIEILSYLPRKNLIAMNQVSRKFHQQLVPRSYPSTQSLLWLPTSAYLMFPNDNLYELKAIYHEQESLEDNYSEGFETCSEESLDSNQPMSDGVKEKEEAKFPDLVQRYWNECQFKKVNFTNEAESIIWNKVIQVNETDVYFISGKFETSSFKKACDCFRYNIHTKEMTKIAPIKHPRTAFGLTHIRNYIYVFGGDEHVLQGERYNIITDEWEYFGDKWPYHLIAVTAGKFKERYIFSAGGINY